jgi:tripartite-type tricarboxylate transporter receptor subunit TctC
MLMKKYNYAEYVCRSNLVDTCKWQRALRKALKAENAMTLQRRQFLRLTTSAAVLSAMSSFAWSQAYPSRPVRILVGFPAGGPSDTLARQIGQWLSEHLGQPFIVENRPGAGSNFAVGTVVRAPPDGYTLLLVSSSAFTNATLYDKLDFNIVRDIAPVASIAYGAYVMVVNPSMPAKTVPEFIAYAKANPGKITMASAGVGSVPHVAGELFKAMAGVNMLHVPYRGDTPALTDLLADRVQLYFSTIPTAIEFIRAGKLRALAVTSSTRSAALPNIPTMAASVPGYEATAWFGLGAPEGTPADIVDKLNSEINAALVDPKVKVRLPDLGMTPHTSSPADFGKLIADETEKWAKVIRMANIKPE